METKMITKEKLHELFEYKDGVLYWKEDRYRRKCKGKSAGSLKDNRYFMVTVEGKKYYIHRLVFMMFNGYFPDYVDHVDGNGLNNRIENLRECNAQQNQFNSKVSKNSKTGVKNVSWSRQNKKWIVAFMFEGRQNYYGGYDTIEEAAEIAEKVRKMEHNIFSRTK
jgi:1-aminocyclopropane-1-carboxylate deaminase/D-cysteine desulfhydrase-like pyridoxal-dependent ACC family enzyme